MITIFLQILSLQPRISKVVFNHKHFFSQYVRTILVTNYHFIIGSFSLFKLKNIPCILIYSISFYLSYPLLLVQYHRSGLFKCFLNWEIFPNFNLFRPSIPVFILLDFTLLTLVLKWYIIRNTMVCGGGG